MEYFVGFRVCIEELCVVVDFGVVSYMEYECFLIVDVCLFDCWVD